ncbi:MAG: response regulator [Epsilonproteobacteria bacterium]|nr:response regulator [Campylobacterota bacterium]
MKKYLSLRIALLVGSALILTLFGVLIGSIVINDIQNEMLSHRVNELHATQEVKKKHIQDFMRFRLQDIELLGQSPQTISLTQRLVNLYGRMKKSYNKEKYLRDRKVRQLFEEHDDFFQKYLQGYDFSDIYILCKEHGHILYNTQKSSDLGESLGETPLNETKFAKLYRDVIEQKRVMLSDMELYAPKDNAAVMFIAAPVIGEKGSIIAVVAAELPAARITKLVEVAADDMQSKEIYLIGTDYLPRSDTLLGSAKHRLISAFKEPAAAKIETLAAVKAMQGEHGELIQKDYRGNETISVYDGIDLGSFKWGIVSKADIQEINMPIKEEIRKIILYIALCILIAFASVLYFTRKLVSHIEKLANNAQRLSKGEFAIEQTSELFIELEPIGKMLQDQSRVLGQLSGDIANIQHGVTEGRIDARIMTQRYGGDFAKMSETINNILSILAHTIWIKRGVAELMLSVSNKESLQIQTSEALAFIASYLGASVGALYCYRPQTEELERKATYAYVNSEEFQESFSVGEGIIGQVASGKKPIVFESLSPSGLHVASATAVIAPYALYAYPMLYKGEVIGVMELGSNTAFTKMQQEFLVNSLEALSVTLYASKQSEETKRLLTETMEQKTELETQSEELMHSNVMLEEQQQRLEALTHDLQIRNEQLEKTQSELIVKAEALERTSRYKSEFLANTSHELRTPLNSIILLSKLLKEEGSNILGEENVKKAEVIHKSGSELLHLINDILDLSKIEAGRLEPSKKAFNTQELTHELYELFSESAKEKGLFFNVNDEYGGELYTDKERLSQILKNLLSNAFKFTHNGSVTLGIKRREGTRSMLELSVTDTGIGITKEQESFIFEPFRQADGSTSRKYGGTGLGLSISKGLAEMLGGEITLQSKPGEGSRFSLFIPLQGLDSDDKEQTYPQEPETVITQSEDELAENPKVNLEGVRVLIADDDARNIFALTSMFESQGADILNAFNGTEALEVLKQEKIDIVLMDIMMPELDGYETIRKIRKDLSMHELPIIAMSAKTMQEDREQCLQAGASDYLSKPLDFDILSKMVEGWVRRT